MMHFSCSAEMCWVSTTRSLLIFKFAAARSTLRAVLHLHRNQIGDGGATILGEAVK